jgi:hypothetical protein
MAGNRNAADVRQADWDMVRIHYAEKPLPAEYRRHRPLPGGEHPVTVMAADAAYKSVLADVGANARLDEAGKWHANSDAADRRVVEDVRQGKGEGTRHEGNRTHYSHPDQVGGYPKIAPGVPYADADHDGMADAWELAHGLNPRDASDGGRDSDEDGYTNLEEFLNGTDPRRRGSSRD